MDGNTTLGVLFGLGLGAAACLVVVNGQTPSNPASFEVTSIKENAFASRPVVDKTDLDGVFDLELRWVPEQGPSDPEGTSARAAPSSDGVSAQRPVED